MVDLDAHSSLIDGDDVGSCLVLERGGQQPGLDSSCLVRVVRSLWTSFRPRTQNDTQKSALARTVMRDSHSQTSSLIRCSSPQVTKARSFATKVHDTAPSQANDEVETDIHTGPKKRCAELGIGHQDQLGPFCDRAQTLEETSVHAPLVPI